jgi:hypothetical protein
MSVALWRTLRLVENDGIGHRWACAARAAFSRAKSSPA